MIITFKSKDYIFEKEKDGRKPNTFRKVDNLDERFEFLSNNTITGIQIINKNNPEEFFIRKVSDITFWDGYVIISWEHNSKISIGVKK